MDTIGVGLIGNRLHGQGAMRWPGIRCGRCSATCRTCGSSISARRTTICAKQKAAEFGFEKASGDWRKVIADPEVDVVSITTPNRFHLEMASAALAAGKHVWCEKPMAPKLADAEAMLAAARASGKIADPRLQLHPEPGHPAYQEAARRGRDRAGQPCPHRDGRGFPGRSRSAVPAAPRGVQRLWRDRRFRRASAVAAA